jgi:hypothetical protein
VTARATSLIEMYTGQRGVVRELLDDVKELNQQIDRLVADPRWLLVEPDAPMIYAADEDPV